MSGAWLRFFRVVNLPTVPGDVLVGASAFLFGVARAQRAADYDVSAAFRLVAFAALASVLLYLFGLADNDIVGAKTDTGRPIPDGELSLGAARLARGLCLGLAMFVGAAANLPPSWWIVAFALTLAMVVYNRTKWAAVMGFCRALNVVCGVAVLVVSWASRNDLPVGTLQDLSVTVPYWAPVVLLWWLYIAGVTFYSEGEEADLAKRRRVGFLVGAVVYLQLVALMLFTVRPLLVAGAVLLVLLRFAKRLLPKVSAS